MPKYQCRLGTAQGDVVVQEFVAPTDSVLREQLEGKGYFIFSMKAKTAWGDIFSFVMPKKRRIPMSEFILFNQEFSALLKAGLPVLTGLDLLLSRRREGLFARLLVQIRDEVRSGSALSEAFKNQGDAFPRIYSATLAAGERSGELVAVIQRYLFYTKTVQSIRKKVISAMIYPIILLILAGGLLALLMIVIVPKFSTLFSGAGGKLPFLTVAVMSVSKVFQVAWPVVIAIIVLTPMALRLAQSKPRWRLSAARLRLRLPVLGPNTRRYNIGQMCRTLGTLVAGGIPVVTALDVVADALSNEVYRVELRQVKGKVLEGQSLWQSMERTSMMSPLALEMIEVGESTGALAEMLDQVGEFYDEELSTSVERLVALLEPALLLVMAVVIAIVVLSVYMPLFSMYSLVGN
jgi:type IV pilus assembly protein PilC